MAGSEDKSPLKISWLATLLCFWAFVLHGYGYSQEHILFEGRGFRDITIGQSSKDQLLAKLGKPDKVEQTKARHSVNYLYKKLGLKFNFHGDRVNTISTLPNFRGQTSRGITLRSSLNDIRATYGQPELPPGQTIKKALVWTYPEHGVIFWLKQRWLFATPAGVEKIVIWRVAKD
jgi:hypothetical protein